MNLRTVRAKSVKDRTRIHPFIRFAGRLPWKSPFQYADHYQFWDARTSLDRMLSLAAFGISNDEEHHDQKLKKNAHLVTK
jgi:hypothetical protein